MHYIGVDPGVSGGIVAIDDDGAVRFVFKMPDTPQGVLDAFRQIVVDSPAHPRAMLEHVRSSPQMGVVSAFTFGRGLGVLETALATYVIPYDTVTPRKWQTALSCLSQGDKNVTKRRAGQLFPSLLVTHAYADALLLAEYCRRVHCGILPQKAVRSHVQEVTEARETVAHVHGEAFSGRPAGKPEAFGEWVARTEAQAGSTLAAPAGHGAGPRSRPRSRV